MATRPPARQSEHDDAVRAAASIYRERGKVVWINPDGEKNKPWSDRYVDVIALNAASTTSAWVIEVETADSVSEREASGQWEDYAAAYSRRWYLAVPLESEDEARRLLRAHRITNCTVVTWQRNANGTHTFWGLPGLS